MKKLPIGISSLSKIIQGGYAYVDKTPLVKQLVESGSYFFLSRPRRFGKSLLIDTLKEAFEGHRELFTGLWLHDHWEWDRPYPVILFSFAEGVIKSREELTRKIFAILDANQERLGVSCQYRDSVSNCFSQIIRETRKKFDRRVVILIDEYDKPILDNITDTEIAAELREGLKDLYSVIKGHDANIHFAFLTGVSKFSKVSLFSGLNNLTDITLDSQYATLCGYTETEMTAAFADHLKGKSVSEIRQWYNGYAWLGEAVYNPFSILNFLRTGVFRNYWFETGTPDFLVKMIMERNHLVPELQNATATEQLLGSFDVGLIEIETILFQTGYLTIQNTQQLGNLTLYRLGFPNLEVKMSFADSISAYLVSHRSAYEKQKVSLYQALAEGRPEHIKTVFQSLFAAIPHDWYRKNRLAEYEGYYASIFYCYFAALGVAVTAEDTTNHGRVDMAVRLEERVYLFEFKVVDLDPTPGAALEQIREKGYADKYRATAKEIYRIGIEFDRNERNIVRFEWDRA